MKTQLKMTALAVAASMCVAGVAQADDVRNVEYNETTNLVRNKTTNFTYNNETNVNTDVNLGLNAQADISLALGMREVSNRESDIRVQNIQSDVRSERNEHGVSVQLDKELRLASDIAFYGRPTISGDLQIDSAAIAIIDNRQSSIDNTGVNSNVDNTSGISDDVAANASGNLGFNVAAGDNNVQDNAAALSAADASFAFGMADAEIFVNQAGSGNMTLNEGVTNAAGISGNAFMNAAGNIAVNVASGNNNLQKNAMAASVATTRYATATVSSNQHSSGNVVSNNGLAQEFTSSTDVTLTGTVSGAAGGENDGAAIGRGMAYQHRNFYSDNWTGDQHPAGDRDGHSDFDIESQGATANPYQPGHGGLAFDLELSELELQASLTGTVESTQWVIANASNTAGLSGSAFNGASGNIGVNIASGTGNMQANSLAMAVAQPAANGGGGGGGGE